MLVKFVLLVVILAIPHETIAQNCTSSSIIIPVNATFNRNIFNFECVGNQQINANPIFPQSLLSNPNQYNEIDLSPNLYTAVPITQLCAFKKVLKLDLRFNQITSLTSVFKQLACVSSLSSVDISSNLVSSPLVANDFDDALSSQLVSLNLSNNRIPSLESSVFLKSDGTTRFPLLQYLGLANNLIQQLDLLWPLSLPSSNLFVDMKTNPIVSLVNQLRVSFNQPAFRYGMTGKRYLDATNNRLQYLNDGNLLQYGLQTVDDFYAFIIRLQNYDFRQTNLARTFLCYCPQTGSQSVSWFMSIKTYVNLSYPIYQLYCSNLGGSVYVLDISSCGVSFLLDPLLSLILLIHRIFILALYLVGMIIFGRNRNIYFKIEILSD